LTTGNTQLNEYDATLIIMQRLWDKLQNTNVLRIVR